MRADIGQVKKEIEKFGELLDEIKGEFRKSVIGQDHLLSRLLLALLCDGHVLLEGVPGLAKTTAIKALADTIRAKFRRIQFTPDLLPADLIGTLIYNPQSGGFSTRKGPIFANVILADEINRAPAKVQSALLEAMQEHQVTIGDDRFKLDEPFLVMATQNPIEQEGTYPLPEAQVDRFMFKVLITYPTRAEERQVIDLVCEGTPRPVKAVLTPEKVFEMREVVRMVYIDDKLKEYILDLVGATRRPGEYKLDIGKLIEWGGSPRASIHLTNAARANAFLNGRGYVTPQDIKDVAPDILRHRVMLTYEAEAEDIAPDQIVKKILDEIPVP